MADIVEERLSSPKIELLAVVGSVKNYIHTEQTGRLLYVSGQICFGLDGTTIRLYAYKFGGTVSAKDGYAAARLCLLHLLALCSLDRIRKCVRLGGLASAEPDCAVLAAVINGASDTIIEMVGERERYSRGTIGVAALPLGSCAEVEAPLEVAALRRLFARKWETR